MLKKIILSCLLFLSLYSQTTVPIVILGGGIAGMSAALQVSQAGLNPLLVVGPTPGGIITVSPSVENWPGDFSIPGAALADKLEQQLQNRRVSLMKGVVTSVDFSHRPFTIHVTHPLLPEESSTIQAESCIIALGATPHLLHIPGEKPLLYHKIFTCAPCDGHRFKDQTVAVIGGGDSALVEADYLSNIAQKVIVLVRGSAFKTLHPSFKEKLLSKPNVKVFFQTTVQKFQDDKEGVTIHLKPKSSLIVQGIFLAIGSRPNTDILKNSVKLDPRGYILLAKGQATSTPGVFAAGDVSDPTYRQAITAAGDAAKAALEAIQFLSNPTPQAAASALSCVPLKEIGDLEAFQTILHSSNQPIIAYFYSPYCSPCRSFSPLYYKWSQEYGSLATFVKINVQNCPACVQTYNIQELPTLLILDPKGNTICQASIELEMAKIIKFLEERKK